MGFVDLQLLTWPEAGALRETDAIGLIGTGAVEQHGPHLPLSMDSVHVAALCRAVAERLDLTVVVAPTVSVGLSSHHIAFPGTITLTPEVFAGVVNARIEAFERIGIHRIAIVSGHGGNFAAIGHLAASHSGSEAGTTVIAYSDLTRFLEVCMTAARTAGLDPPATDVHAGLLETSLALTLFDHSLIRPYGNVEGYLAGDEGWLGTILEHGVDRLSPNGVLGSPPDATEHAGEVVFAALADELAGWIADSFGLAGSGDET